MTTVSTTNRYALVSRITTAAMVLLGVIGWVVIAPTAAADGPTTFTNTASITIPATGSAEQRGPANPYPSSISVSGMAGSVTAVTVSFRNLTHGAVNDIDAMVVAPSGENLLLLSDIGDPDRLAFSNNATLTFADSAAGPLPAGNIPSGTYKPTNNGGGDAFPSPAPGPSSQTTLDSAFTGISPNGSWRLFVVDDNTGDTGTMAGGWSLTITTEVDAAATTTSVTTSGTPSTTGDPVTFTATVHSGGSPVTAGTVQFSDGGTALGGPVTVNGSGVARLTTSALTEGSHEIRATYSGATGFLTSNGSVTQRVDNATVVNGNTFCNPGPIAVPGLGTARPYPSNITVSGLSGQVTEVTATLKGLSHTVPVDLDVMLVGPTPSRNVVLLSDSGGQSSVSGLSMTFDDDATGSVPNPLTSGTFRPTDNDTDGADPFPSPAPAPSAAAALSTFDGASPNGTWSLYVNDDASGDAGSISGGWCITVTALAATETALTSAPNPSTVGQSVTLTATVTSGDAAVTAGSVRFFDGGVALGGPVDVGAEGTATLTTSALAAGTHEITASYGGTSSFAESFDELDQVVNLVETVTTLTAAPNPSTVGQSVTFTATVTAGGAPVNAGVVQFSVEGADVGGPVALAADGTATLSTADLAVGTQTVTARFTGTSTFAESSDELDQVVNRAGTVTTLTSAPNPSTVGQSVTFTATVTATGGNPVTDGTVAFLVDGTVMQPSTDLDENGTATFTTSALTAGSHTVLAEYSGSGAYLASDGTVEQTVSVAANAGGPYTVAEGEDLTLDGSGTSPGATYEWDVNGDGDFSDATGASPTLTWDDLESFGITDGPAGYEVSLRASIGSVTVVSAVTSLEVVNTPPIVVVTGDVTVTVDELFELQLSATDPSSADRAAAFGYTVDWGDGSPIQTLDGPAELTVSHTYATTGEFSASFTATDIDGGTSEVTVVRLQVDPDAPTTDPPATSDPSSNDGDHGDSDRHLASTGASVSAWFVATAAVLLLAGKALLVVVRRRRKALHWLCAEADDT